MELDDVERAIREARAARGAEEEGEGEAGAPGGGYSLRPSTLAASADVVGGGGSSAGIPADFSKSSSICAVEDSSGVGQGVMRGLLESVAVKAPATHSFVSVQSLLNDQSNPPAPSPRASVLMVDGSGVDLSLVGADETLFHDASFAEESESPSFASPDKDGGGGGRL